MKFYNKNYKIGLLYIFTVISIFYLFKDITFTDDFFSYEEGYYTQSSDDREISAYLVESLFYKLGLTFNQYYNIILFLQIVLFAFVFRKYNVNIWWAMVCQVLINYVQMANQIYYFISLPLFLLSINYWLYEKKIMRSLMLALLSISFHFGILSLYIFIPMYYYIVRHRYSIKQVVVFFIVTGLAALCVVNSLLQVVISINPNYAAYLSEGASASGMLFILLSPLLLMSFVFKKVKFINMGDMLTNSRLIAILSLFPIFWCVVSVCGMQIINARYVNALFPIWVICMLCRDKDANLKYSIFRFLSFLFTAFTLKYLIPNLLFGYEYTDLYKIGLIYMSRI